MSPPQEIAQVYPAYDRKRRESRGLRRLLYALSPIPLHTLHPLVFELRLSLVRSRRHLVRRRLRDADELLVNIGPGRGGRAGWANVDIFAGPNIDYIYDCRKSLPFTDNSVRAIFCEHVIEHMDYTEEVPHFVSECYRVLQPGGVLRVIVPDAGRYLQAYCAGEWEGLESLRQLQSGRVDPHQGSRYETRMELVNAIFRQGYEHKFAYDWETLHHVLRKYGFSEVIHQEFGRSVANGLAIDDSRRASESLYVEAIKK